METSTSYKKSWEDNEEESDSESARELLGYLKSKVPNQGATILKEDELLAKLEQIKVRMSNGEEINFEEKFTLTTNEPTVIENVEDDIQRELSFYNQSLEIVKRAAIECNNIGIKWKRPDDYFAEMLKSDAHMEKLKSKLIFEKKRMETIETRKKQQQSKKFGKEIQKIQQQKKLQEKKNAIDSVTKWRKARANGNGQDDFDVELEDLIDNKPNGVGSKKRKFDGPGKSSNNNSRDNKKAKFSGGKGTSNGKRTQKRPGKRTRQQRGGKR